MAASIASADGTVKHFAASAASQAITRWARVAWPAHHVAAALALPCSSLQPAVCSPVTVVSLMCCSYENVAISFGEGHSHGVRQEVSIESPSTSQTVQVVGQEAG